MSSTAESPSVHRCDGTVLPECDHWPRAFSNSRAGSMGAKITMNDFNGRPTAPMNSGGLIAEPTGCTT
jgi:hypothetical protein